MKLPRIRADYGSILLGSADESSRVTRIRVQLVITVGVIVSNLIGVALAITLALVGIPQPPIPWEPWWMPFLVVPAYITIAFVFGAALGTVRTVRSLRWSIRREEPNAAEARTALTAPWRLTALQAVLWAVGTVVMTVGYGLIDARLIPKIALVTGLSGVVVCAIAYQITEFALRPAAAQALEAGYRAPRKGRLRMRAATAWAIGSGVPILGMFLVTLLGTFGADDTSKLDIFVAISTLAAIALLTGPLLTLLNTDTLVAPLRVLGDAMRRVRDGETDVSVRIFDGSDMGELQAGFNEMTVGLAERERVRDLFGRHVGRDVAEAALGWGVQLGGAEQVVGVLFVDVVGSTTLARQRPATEVVELLNRFFEVIVTAVEENDGLVNKFEGDAVLAVFGAPLPHPDPAGGALRASRRIAERLPAAVPGLAAGIGVSYGVVVAGNVGAIERYEFTVIGDPVNESARLSEVAKRDTSLPVASEPAFMGARESESQHWRFTDEIVLRGRDVPTRLYSPATPCAAPAGASSSTSSTNTVEPTENRRSPATTNPDFA